MFRSAEEGHVSCRCPASASLVELLIESPVPRKVENDSGEASVERKHEIASANRVESCSLCHRSLGFGGGLCPVATNRRLQSDVQITPSRQKPRPSHIDDWMIDKLGLSRAYVNENRMKKRKSGQEIAARLRNASATSWTRPSVRYVPGSICQVCPRSVPPTACQAPLLPLFCQLIENTRKIPPANYAHLFCPCAHTERMVGLNRSRFRGSAFAGSLQEKKFPLFGRIFAHKSFGINKTLLKPRTKTYQNVPKRTG